MERAAKQPATPPELMLRPSRQAFPATADCAVSPILRSVLCMPCHAMRAHVGTAAQVDKQGHNSIDYHALCSGA